MGRKKKEQKPTKAKTAWSRNPLTAPDGGRTSPWWGLVPAIIGLLWFGTLYVRGRVYRIPVPSRVLSGDVVRPTHVYLTWNESADAKVSLQVQVATDPKFRNIVFEVEQENISRVQVPGKLVTSGETYYWHVRSQKDGKYSPWTRLIHFKVQD